MSLDENDFFAIRQRQFVFTQKRKFVFVDILFLSSFRHQKRRGREKLTGDTVGKMKDKKKETLAKKFNI